MRDAMPDWEWGRWPAVERELRRAPRVDPGAVDRIMDEVRASRIEPAPRPDAPDGARRRLGMLGPVAWLTARTVTLAPLHLLAASLLLAAGAYGLARRRPAIPAPAAPAAIVTAAAADGLQPVQFVFVAAGAQEVALAGDFNDWDPRATPLRRISAEGVWSIVVPLSPGRHVYSFVVDGTRWVPDASAPRAPEDEFGGENSVVHVARGS